MLVPITVQQPHMQCATIIKHGLDQVMNNCNKFFLIEVEKQSEHQPQLKACTSEHSCSLLLQKQN